ASFGVLDLAAGAVLGEIDTAGCVEVIPSGHYRVSSLCESGRLLTVTLDAQGHEVAHAMSEPFFDADQGPLFVQGIPSTQGNVFLSFLGEVHEIDFSGAQPTFTPPWSLVSAAEKGHWRPGANQVGAIHRELGRLYVSMHEGGEGTHKDGGTEIWVYDLASHRRLARWPLKVHGLSRVTAVQVSQDPAPILFAATETSDLAVFDALTGRLRHITNPVAQSPGMLLNPYPRGAHDAHPRSVVRPLDALTGAAPLAPEPAGVARAAAPRRSAPAVTAGGPRQSRERG